VQKYGKGPGRQGRWQVGRKTGGLRDKRVKRDKEVLVLAALFGKLAINCLPHPAAYELVAPAVISKRVLRILSYRLC
jgi:hypothetical protein